jgi:hypothetical protein
MGRDTSSSKSKHLDVDRVEQLGIYEAALLAFPMAAIGDVLRRLRTERKLSLRAVGREVGIFFNTLSAYERNASSVWA